MIGYDHPDYLESSNEEKAQKESVDKKGLHKWLREHGQKSPKKAIVDLDTLEIKEVEE